MVKGKTERKGLGRGLSALMADVDSASDRVAAEQTPRRPEAFIDISLISPNPDQPRRTFVEGALEELANSVREKGVIQPLILRRDPKDSGRYEIVAGERRWRAAQRAQLHQVPAIVRDLDDTEVLELAIIENIQRADLNAVEEAAGYRQLMQRFGHTQEKLATALGKSRSHIANLLRLLNLPDDVLDYVRTGALSAGHARALVGSENASELAKDILKRGLSVREVEALIKSIANSAKADQPQKTTVKSKDTDTRRIEEDLTAALGLPVTISHNEGQESGNISLKYKNLDQLDEICRKLSATGETLAN